VRRHRLSNLEPEAADEIPGIQFTTDELREIKRIIGIGDEEAQTQFLRGLKITLLEYRNLRHLDHFRKEGILVPLNSVATAIDELLKVFHASFALPISRLNEEMSKTQDRDGAKASQDSKGFTAVEARIAEWAILAYMEVSGEYPADSIYARLYEIQGDLGKRLMEYRALVQGAIQDVEGIGAGRRPKNAGEVLVEMLANVYEKATGERPGISPDNNFGELVEWCLSYLGEKSGHAYGYIRASLASDQKTPKTTRHVYRKKHVR
jgi:hypothetical protein